MKIIRSYLYPIVLGIGGFVGVLVVVSLGSSVWRLWQQRGILDRRQLVLNELKLKEAELQKQLEEAKSPGFIEKVVREELGWVRPGETVVIIPKSESTRKSQVTQAQKPSWRVWWRLFF